MFPIVASSSRAALALGARARLGTSTTMQEIPALHCDVQNKQRCWAEAPVKIARMTLTIKLDGNWSSFQLANNTPPLSVTGSVIAPSARMSWRRRETARAGHSLGRGCFITLAAGARWKRGPFFQFFPHLSMEGRRRPFLAADKNVHIVGSSSQAGCLQRNSAMDDSIGGS